MLEAQTDDELVSRIGVGDHEAFSQFMRRHTRRMLSLAQGVLGNAADADEVVQDAFIRVWRHAGRFDPARARATTWLHRIVVNLAIDRLRRPRQEPLDGHDELPDEEPSALDRMIESERERLVASTLESLADRQRIAITLFHLQGLSGRQGAEVMGLSEDAFESLLTRARQSLKKRLRDKNGEA